MSHTAKFVKQQYGAVVATILETDDSIVEVQERNDGVYGLIVHHRRCDRDTWDDLSAYLKPEHFEMLGSVAKRMRGEDTTAPVNEAAEPVRSEPKASEPVPSLPTPPKDETHGDDVVERAVAWLDAANKQDATFALVSDLVAELARRSPSPDAEAARREAIEEAAKLLDLRAQDILLIGGEMSLRELNAVRAMLNERARAIRALSPPVEGE